MHINKTKYLQTKQIFLERANLHKISDKQKHSINHAKYAY
ncbi:hypothetical protein VCRA2123O443_10624 [Vibrio crassostreae]|nr:hypothetical protein VCRA2110O182_10195 [Vibrio crassostreae]CAK2299854.1 hypothetical protein VCRA2111O408_10677 [Vibrio crassostreae]CAK2302159.1 hypothetical protein VCRA211O406_10195 [Vibrio crassostreae]CAK3198857.1 hypothetical protein VCRA2123O443_10624 [Vibrio crassostreae]